MNTLPLLGIFFAFLGFLSGVPSKANPPVPPHLTVTPQSTVILDGSDYAGRLLQYQLIKSCVGPDAAAPYGPDAKINRAESPYFPLLSDKPDTKVPEDKVVLAVGNTRFLTPDDREKLTNNPGAILISRDRQALRPPYASFSTRQPGFVFTRLPSFGVANRMAAPLKSSRSTCSENSFSKRVFLPLIKRNTANGWV
jgi:hypothetical protein